MAIKDIPIWGREVIIRIPENNTFLLGEKVLISVMAKKKIVSSSPLFAGN